MLALAAEDGCATGELRQGFIYKQVPHLTRGNIAVNIAKSRLMTATFPYYLRYDSEAGRRYRVAQASAPASSGGVPAARARSEDAPATRSRDGCATGNLRQGFSYKQVPHSTRGSIPNNEPPRPRTFSSTPKRTTTGSAATAPAVINPRWTLNPS